VKKHDRYFNTGDLIQIIDFTDIEGWKSRQSNLSINNSKEWARNPRAGEMRGNMLLSGFWVMVLNKFPQELLNFGSVYIKNEI
jgi:hypothetical protein